MKTFILVLLVAIGGFANASSSGSIQELNWMAGQWRGDYHGAVMDAFYSEPAGQMILGQTKISSGDQVEFFEFEKIVQVNDTIELTPMPFGQIDVTFGLKEITKNRVVFENPQHDFPTRIIYELKESGDLFARIEGMQNGSPASEDFLFSKVK